MLIPEDKKPFPGITDLVHENIIQTFFNKVSANMLREDSKVGCYRVMQSDRNSFCGDVVLESFYKASRDEGSILDQIYKSKYARTIIVKI